MVNFNNLVNKAKEYAGKNPDKVRQGLEKAEGLINEKTGGKYQDKIAKGGDAIEGQLGVPAENQTNTGDQPQPQAGAQPGQPQPQDQQNPPQVQDPSQQNDVTPGQ